MGTEKEIVIEKRDENTVVRKHVVTKEEIISIDKLIAAKENLEASKQRFIESIDKQINELDSQIQEAKKQGVLTKEEIENQEKDKILNPSVKTVR